MKIGTHLSSVLTITTLSIGKRLFLGFIQSALMFSCSYCFYTGSRPGQVLEHPDFVPLSPLESGIEDFFSSAY